MSIRATLRRYHVWLGWLVGIPFLFWTISGLVMVMRPIEEVRGSDLIAPLKPIATLGHAIVPNIDGRAIESLKLERRSGGPRWVISFADGGTRLADPRTGRLLPALSAADAAQEVASRYTGQAKIVSTTRTDAKNPPIELRRPIETWKVAMSDDTHFYVDTGSGEIVAKRTGWWRIYDFFWGLHIMDLQGREDSNNPWVVTFAFLASLTAVLAIVLLPLTNNRRKANGGDRPKR